MRYLTLLGRTFALGLGIVWHLSAHGQLTTIAALHWERTVSSGYFFDPDDYINDPILRSIGFTVVVQKSSPASVKGTLQLGFLRRSVIANTEYGSYAYLDQRIDEWRTLTLMPGVKVYAVRERLFLHLAGGIALNRFQLNAVTYPPEADLYFTPSTSVNLESSKGSSVGPVAQGGLGWESEQIELAAGLSVFMMPSKEGYVDDLGNPYYYGGLEDAENWSIWLRFGFKFN